MDYQKRNPNNKTKVINARVSSDVLEALALAEGMIPKDINNSNEFSISKIIKKALNDQLAKIEELHSIDLIRLVEWEKRINSLFDENVKKLKAGDITGNEAGKALGRIFKYDIRIQQRNIANKAINLLINEGTIKNSIDDNIKRGALFIPYSINKKPLKITREIKNTVKSIDLANKSSNEACNELTRFIFNHADKEPYIKVIGLGQGNDKFFTDSIAIYLKKHSQVKAYKYDGIVNALYVNLESFTDENFDRVFESIKQEIYRDISKYESFEDLLIAKEKQFIETWDKAFSSQKSKSNVDTFEDISLDIGDWSNYLAINEINKNVEEELEQFRSQQSITNAQGSTQTLERMKILEAVNTEVNHRGSSCTELVMGDGTRLYMKTITFDRGLIVTAKAKSLVGKKVKTSCWDPISEPGKWSRQGYFRNVYALSDEDLN